MVFRSDKQRRAMFANIFSQKNVNNKFTLDIVRDKYMPKDVKRYYNIKSNENPKVDVSLYNFDNVPISKIKNVLTKVDDSNLADLESILIVPDNSILLQGPYSMGYYAFDDNAIVVNSDDFKRDNEGSVLIHEIGHHVMDSIKKGGLSYNEDLAELYRDEAFNEDKEYRTWESLEDYNAGLLPIDYEPVRQDMVYYKTIKDLNNPSIHELEEYAK